MAKGRSDARFHHFARILALGIEAGGFRSAVGIYPAFRPDFGTALNVGIPLESAATSTERQVIPYGAFRPGRTRVVIKAGVYALPVYARSVRWTIAVASTSDYKTSISRIPAITAEATALRFVVKYVTFCVQAARIVNQTRIHAVSIDASFS